MLDSDTEGEGDMGGTINPSVAMAIAGGPLAPGSRASISQGPATVSTSLVPRDPIQHWIVFVPASNVFSPLSITSSCLFTCLVILLLYFGHCVSDNLVMEFMQ